MSKCCSTVVGMLATFGTTYMIGYGYGGFPKDKQKEPEKPQIFTEKPGIELPSIEETLPPQPTGGEPTTLYRYLGYATANVVGLAGVVYTLRNGFLYVNRPGWDVMNTLYRIIARARGYNPFAFMDNITRTIGQIRQFQNTTFFGQQQILQNITDKLKFLYDAVDKNTLGFNKVIGELENISQIANKSNTGLGNMIKTLQEQLFKNASETDKQGNLLQDIINTQKQINENINQRIAEVNERYKINMEGPQQDILNNLKQIQQELIGREEHGKLFDELSAAIKKGREEGQLTTEELRKLIKERDEAMRKEIDELVQDKQKFFDLLSRLPNPEKKDQPPKPGTFIVEDRSGQRVFGRGSNIMTLSELKGKEEKNEPSQEAQQLTEQAENMLQGLMSSGVVRGLQSPNLDPPFMEEYEEIPIERKMREMRQRRIQVQDEIEKGSRRTTALEREKKKLDVIIDRITRINPEYVRTSRRWNEIIGQYDYQNETNIIKLREALYYCVKVLYLVLSEGYGVNTQVYPIYRPSKKDILPGEISLGNWVNIFYEVYNTYLNKVGDKKNTMALIELINQAMRILQRAGVPNLPIFNDVVIERGFEDLRDFYFKLLRIMIRQSGMIQGFIRGGRYPRDLPNSIAILMDILSQIAGMKPFEVDYNNLSEEELKKIFSELAKHFLKD